MLILAGGSVATEPARKFVLFGGLHLFILGTTIVLPFAMSRFTRRDRRPRLARILAAALAVVLLSDRIFAVALGYHEHRITRWADALPMHLCDWASIAVIITLVWRRQLLYELAYFWGLAGTLQAVLTPDLAEQFPNPFFISFFVEHCGIIVGVLFMTWGLGMRPRPGAVWRVFLWTQFYVVCAAGVNWTFATNYGYLTHKPVHSSLLDYFGPWPWYILSLEGLAVVLYTILYLPFWAGCRTASASWDRE
jgi:hypothetical integral membrane protein (TIGR02206 family)